MMDITKEEFWEMGYREIPKRKEKNSKLSNIKEVIFKNKIITIGLVTFLLCAAINTFLIFNFFKFINTI